jgi:RNA polymerase-binding transcription factor DksA
MDTAAYKSKLQAKKEQLESQLNQFATKDPNLKGDWDTKYPRTPEGNLEEAADEVEEYSNKIHIEFSLETQLRNVNGALERIENSSYGVCQKCQNPIAPERLEISPESATCSACAQ